MTLTSATLITTSGVKRSARPASHIHRPRKPDHNDIATAEDGYSYADI